MHLAWHSAQGSQKKWVIQSGAGDSVRPNLPLNFVRYMHDIMQGIPTNMAINPYNSPLVEHAVYIYVYYAANTGQ